jgi:hypothetical protein
VPLFKTSAGQDVGCVPVTPIAPGLAPAEVPGQQDEPVTPPAAAPDEGSGGLLVGPDLRRGQTPTLYENYGTAAFDLDSDYGLGDAGDKLKNFGASILWAGVVWVGDLSAKLLQWAFSIDVFEMAGNAVDQVVGALERTVYRPFLLSFLVLAGAYLLWQGVIRRRGTVVGETTAWIVAALVGAGLFLANPGAVTDGLNKATTGVARSILAGVSSVDPKVGPDDGVTSRGGFGGDPADTQLRVSADRFMRVFVYKPWLAMEFGDAEKGQQWGERLIQAKALSVSEAERARRDSSARREINESKKGEYEAIAKEIKDDPQAKEWFNGHRAGQRISLAGMSFVAVVVAGGILVVLALAVLFAQLAMLMLAMLAPIFLLAAIQPGPGRVLATRWLGLLLGAAFKRIAYAALFAVVLVVSGVLVDQGSQLGWGVAMILQVALSGALVVYRKPLLSVFEHIGNPAGWGIPGRTSVSSSGRGIVGGVLAGAALGRMVGHQSSTAPRTTDGYRNGDRAGGGVAAYRASGAASNGTAANGSATASAGGGASAGAALVGGAVVGLATKDVVDRHRSQVTRYLTDDLDDGPSAPEPNRRAQSLPVILERQRQRRWQEQRPESPEIPRREPRNHGDDR